MKKKQVTFREHGDMAAPVITVDNARYQEDYQEHVVRMLKTFLSGEQLFIGTYRTDGEMCIRDSLCGIAHRHGCPPWPGRWQHYTSTPRKRQDARKDTHICCGKPCKKCAGRSLNVKKY